MKKAKSLSERRSRFADEGENAGYGSCLRTASKSREQRYVT